MSKMPISWHEKCLKNATDYYQRERKRIQAEMDECDRASKELFKYDAQIIAAKERGLDSFDKNKFGKKRSTAPEGSK